MAILKGLTTTKFTFKKLAMGAAIAGLVVVPSLVAAESTGTTGSTTTTSSTSSTDPTSTSTGTTGTTVVATPTTGTSTSSTTSTDSSTTGSVTTSTGTTVPTTTTTTSTTSVSFQQAVDTAQNFFSSKAIVKAVLLESHSNAPMYMVVFSDGSRVIVDANSGSVVFSYDTATQTTTGTNPLGDEDENDSDSDSGHASMHMSHASLKGQEESNARLSQGFEREN